MSACAPCRHSAAARFCEGGHGGQARRNCICICSCTLLPNDGMGTNLPNSLRLQSPTDRQRATKVLFGAALARGSLAELLALVNALLRGALIKSRFLPHILVVVPNPFVQHPSRRRFRSCG